MQAQDVRTAASPSGRRAPDNGDNTGATPGAALSLSDRPDAPARYLGFSAVATLIVFLAVALAPDGRAYLTESGPVETLSPLLYFLGAAVLCTRFRSVWPFVVMLLAFALREYDLDKRMFTEGLLKSRQYVGDTVALPERLISLIILVGLLISGSVAVRRSLRGVVARLRARDGVALCVALGVFFLITSKSVDGLNRKLAPYDIQVSDLVVQWATYYEEVAELGAALSFALASVAFIRMLRRVVPA